MCAEWAYALGSSSK